ncbi:MAG: type II toxin-antitoxin system HigB family toxin [Planctomycetes bacterium]|nr:type II toxin-antitoxin system HigB family toxin [Planctomycetota bacterium]NUQ33987.1 type II toxin-antitoxin system HigB family toxin [Planctomycetaceae bacterium]
MQLTGVERILAFTRKHASARKAMAVFVRTVKEAEWRHSADMQRCSFGSDIVGKLEDGRFIVEFDVGGNKYRVKAAVNFEAWAVHILKARTHAEYDKEYGL